MIAFSRTVLLTNVTQYAGPGTLSVLLQQRMRVVCHDPSFADERLLREFRISYPGVICLKRADAEGLVAEMEEGGLCPHAVVSNDVYPITHAEIGEIDIDDLRRTFEAVTVFPVQLTQLLLPAMKARRCGSFVFVTSARPLRAEVGFAVPTTIRAGSTAFALALAREVASFQLQVNVVAPNYLYSEMYYPRAGFIDDPKGREYIEKNVPVGRLGRPEELGELIAFLISDRAPFVTGQVIPFTGGWP